MCLELCRSIKKERDNGPILKNSSIHAVNFIKCLIYIAIRNIKMKMTSSLRFQFCKEAYMLTGGHNTI